MFEITLKKTISLKTISANSGISYSNVLKTLKDKYPVSGVLNPNCVYCIDNKGNVINAFLTATALKSICSKNPDLLSYVSKNRN